MPELENNGLYGVHTQVARKELIKFYSILLDQEVEFPAFLTNFEDGFESSWSSTEVYGRMDPIQNYKGTRRTINLGWSLVAANIEEAKENMKRCSLLIKMLYPAYESGVMKGSPLIKLKFMNLIKDSAIENGSESVVSAKTGGLTGTIDGFSYKPIMDASHFFQDEGGIYAQNLSLECTFIVLHTHEIGIDTKGSGYDFNKNTYPYNLATLTPPRPAPSSNTSTVSDATAEPGSRARREAEAETRSGIA